MPHSTCGTLGKEGDCHLKVSLIKVRKHGTLHHMAIKLSTSAHIKIVKRIESDQLTASFDQLKALILKYKPGLRVEQNSATHFEVWTTREISIHGKKLRKGLMFVSVARFKDYIGLYFQPLYFKQTVLDESMSELAALKTGVTCFHISDFNDTIEEQTRMLLDSGWNSYKENNWV